MHKFWISLLFLFVLNSGFSQSSGYIGKKHELSIDLFSAAFSNLHANYKFAAFKHFAVILEYNHQRECLNCDFNKYTGNTYGLGILTNSQNPKMEMPIGYYAGLMYTFNNGNLYSKTTTEQVLTDINRGRALKITLGKNTAILPSMSIDINLELGYKWGYLRLDKTSGRNPSLLFPRDNIFSNAARFKKDSINIDSTPAEIHRYARFIVWPRIRIGFMF